MGECEDVRMQVTRFKALDRVMALAEFDLDGRLLHANPNYRQLLQLDQTASLAVAHRDFCPPALLASAAYPAMWERLRNGQAFSGEVERVRSDGSRCWLEATYSPALDEHGRVTHVVKVASDVTERHTQSLAHQAYVERLALVADVSDTAIIISDAMSRILFVNRGFSRMFGWSLAEVQGRAPIDLLAPHLSAGFTEHYQAALRAGEPVVREEMVVGKNGQRYWGKVLSNPVQDGDGAWQYTVTTLTDITTSKMHEVLQRRVLEAMARDCPLVEVLEMVCEEVERIAPEVTASVLEVDADGKLRPLASPCLPASYSMQLDGVTIGPCVGSCGTAAWRNESVVVHDIASDPLWQDFKHLILPLGYTGCWSTPIVGAEGKPIGTFAFYYRDPSTAVASAYHQRLVDTCIDLCALALEREKARSRIRQLAFYDGLTGLPNRSLLLARAEQVLATATLNHERVAVLFVDLDRFKQVNDSLGHPVGDELLCAVAERIKLVLRNADTAGRLSGDEFVLVLSEGDAEQVGQVIERLQEQLSAPLPLGDTSMVISASIGVAMFPGDGRDMETLLHRADMAMYQAKSAGRGCVSFFSSEMNRLAQERLALEKALREALRCERGCLHLHYQPQVDLKTGSLYGVEALARWTHPTLGMIAPARFIPLAEECGLISDLGRWALKEACSQLAQWRAQGLDVPAVAVNLSPSSFHNLDLPRMISATLDSHALQPQDLTLELTESILLDTNPSTMQTIHAVHASGVRLSMDDFGTGYSSLSYLRRLPVSELKLDRSFVSDLEHDEAAQALSRAILGIGQSLGLTVVAEGVETLVQHVMLRDQGYPVAQGYLFAQPMAPQDLAQWLQTQPNMAPQKTEKDVA